MAEGYSTGIQTYLAYGDIAINRLVKIRVGSTTTPVEVELTDTDTVIGVTQSAAKSGELITVKPIYEDGTILIEASGVVAKGNKVYVSTFGRINDEVTAFPIGMALDASAAIGTSIPIALTKIADGTIEAADVTIEDAGDYYTSNNVEGALQEVGSDITNLTASQVAIVDAGGHYTATDTEGALAELGVGLDTEHLGEWCQFENARFGAVGGDPPDNDNALISGNTSGFHYVLNEAYYGNYHLLSDTGSFTEYLVVPFKPVRKVILAPGQHFEVDLSYVCPYTTGTITVTTKVTVCDDYNNKFATPYEEKTVLSISDPGSLELVSIASTDTSLNFRYITIFMKFVCVNTDVPLRLDGMRMQYHTKQIY